MKNSNSYAVSTASLANVDLSNTEEPAFERRRRIAKQIGMFFVAAIGHLNLGMTMAWPNTLASDLETNNSTFLGSHIVFQSWELDMTGSLMFFGTLLGFILGGWLVAWIGRKKSMMILALPCAVGWTLVFLAENTPMVLVGRYIVGISAGLLASSVRPYLAEISDIPVRGVAGLTTEIMKSIGNILMISLGLIFSWYYLALIGTCHILFYSLVVVPLLPESPSYLIMEGKEEKGKEILRHLRGPYADIEFEIKQLKEKNLETNSGNFWSNVFQKDILKKLFIIFGLFFISNFAGSEVLKANALRMMQASGLSLDKDLSTISVFVLQLFGIICQSLIIDRIGRRKCLIASLILILISYSALGALVFIDSSSIDIVPLEAEGNLTAGYDTESVSAEDSTDFFPVICLMVASFGINLGIGPIPWLLSVEYFPTNVRAQMMSACNIVGNLFSFICLQIYSPLEALLTLAGLYWSYAAFAAIGIIYTFFIVVETKKQTIG